VYIYFPIGGELAEQKCHEYDDVVVVVAAAADDDDDNDPSIKQSKHYICIAP